MLKSKAGVIAEVNFEPKAELGEEKKTHPPGDVSETLPYLYKGWLLYTSGWDEELILPNLVTACKLTCQMNWLNVWFKS